MGTQPRAMSGAMMETGGASKTDARLGNLYSMLSTEPEEDLSAMQVARSQDLGSRLHSLDSQFTQVQAIEAEKFKVLRMILDKMEDDLGIESISLDTLKDRYDQEIKKRARKREQMFVKVKEEFCDTLKYIQTEAQARLDSEEYYNRMMDDSTNKMQAEICKECNERELSE